MGIQKLTNRIVENTTTVKRKLQAEIIWASTRSGAFQRSRIYATNAKREAKDEFRKAVKDFLFKEVFLKYHKSSITEKELKTVIRQFINRNLGNPALKNKELRYGNAQKFVTLYLKGMWILGFLGTPPHFPVDRIMLGRLKIKENWTSINKDKYDIIIEKAKKNLKNTDFKTIAEWEANEYLINYINNSNEIN